MKIAVDARMINNSGIGTCIKNWMLNDCYQLALGDENKIKEIDSNIKCINFDAKIYGIKEQVKFPYRRLKKEKIDILHIPHYNVPIFYRGKMIVTIHDLTHLKLPYILPNRIARWYAKIMIYIALKKAYKVITVSENTKKDILSMFKVDPNKIFVIYNGVGNNYTKKSEKEIEYLYKKYNIAKNKKILLYVGNLKPHKNLKKLLEAFSMLDNKENYKLLLVGKAFTNQIDLSLYERQLKIENNVIHTGMVNDEELVNLYNLADLLVFPSLYEGFGLPIIEALSCGTNVIASNISSIPEVGGNYIDYFDPNDQNDIKEKIVKNINKEFDERAYEWIKNFNWENGTDIFKKQVINNEKVY